MNKQEVIKEINNLPKYYANGACVEFEKVSKLINQLDEQEKPVVPQFVADWFEDYKGDLEFNIYNLCIEYRDNGQGVNKDLKEWFGNDSRTKPIETLMKMKFFGYEVEKEKLYTAKLKLTNEYLHYDKNYKEIRHYKIPNDVANKAEGYHFTEDDLIAYNAWENNAYEVKEVEE